MNTSVIDKNPGMIDFEKIERELEAAIDSETKESLTHWILEKREGSFPFDSLDGQINHFPLLELEFELKIEKDNVVKCTSSDQVKTTIDFNIAA